VDHLGTVRYSRTLDPNGNLITGGAVTYKAEPFGVMIPSVTASPNGNTHFYTGHERDTLPNGFNQDYEHFRYYGSSMGRFFKPDSQFDGTPGNPQGWNLYTYVKGNPVNFNDPTGHMRNVPEASAHSMPYMHDQFLSKDFGYEYRKAAVGYQEHHTTLVVATGEDYGDSQEYDEGSWDIAATGLAILKESGGEVGFTRLSDGTVQYHVDPEATRAVNTLDAQCFIKWLESVNTYCNQRGLTIKEVGHIEPAPGTTYEPGVQLRKYNFETKAREPIQGNKAPGTGTAWAGSGYDQAYFQGINDNKNLGQPPTMKDAKYTVFKTSDCWRVFNLKQ
jgi:RHS repeat-associated protein